MIKEQLSRLLGYITPRQNLKPADTAPPKRNDQAQHRIRQNYVYRIAAEMKNWRTALQAAENPLRPDRSLLYALYREIELDDQVTTQMRIAKSTVTNSPFEVLSNDAANEQLTKLFQRPWFEDYLRWSVDTEFWGHSLLEFDPAKAAGEFREAIMIPRDHVKPEYGEFTIYAHDEKGYPYREGKLFPFLLEIGRPWDLGLFRVIAIPVIRKKYADADWSIFSEKYGMPFLTIKTGTRQKNELDAKEEMARNFGANGWAILDDQDELDTILSNPNGNGHKTFQDRMSDSDDRIAKIINGQTGASSEKAWVGSAEVHERILNDFVKMRLTNIQYHINYQLLPFLARHGYPVANARFEFVELRKDAARQGAGEQETPTLGTLGAQKKSLLLSAATSIDEDYAGLTLPPEVLRLAWKPVPAAVGFGIMGKVWRQEVGAGQIDPELWAAYQDTFLQALADGADQESLAQGLDASSPLFPLHKRLRASAWEFAAAKAARVSEELAQAAAGRSGFSDFSEFASARLRRHHGEWLETEYRLGVANTQQAIRWQDIENRKALLPMLRYVTARDERVRHSHALLHGVTLPVDDPFWDKYYPPNGWNCRCAVQQVARPARQPASLPADVPASMRENPGKTGQMFSPKHQYFQSVDESLAAVVRNLAASLPVYDTTYTSTAGGKVETHPVQNPERQADNELAARKLADLGETVRLLPSANQAGKKAPTAEVGGMVTSFRHIAPTATAIQRAIREAIKQGASRVLLTFIQPLQRNELLRALLAARKLGYFDKLEEVWMLEENGMLSKFDKSKITGGKI